MSYKSALTKDLKEGFEKYGRGFEISHVIKNNLYKDRSGIDVEHDVLIFSKDDKSYDLSIIENPDCLLKDFPDNCDWYYVVSLSKGSISNNDFQKIHYCEVGGGAGQGWDYSVCDENDLKEFIDKFYDKMNN